MLGEVAGEELGMEVWGCRRRHTNRPGRGVRTLTATGLRTICGGSPNTGSGLGHGDPAANGKALVDSGGSGGTAPSPLARSYFRELLL